MAQPVRGEEVEDGICRVCMGWYGGGCVVDSLKHAGAEQLGGTRKQHWRNCHIYQVVDIETSMEGCFRQSGLGGFQATLKLAVCPA